jgi:hypothetical protein
MLGRLRLTGGSRPCHRSHVAGPRGASPPGQLPSHRYGHCASFSQFSTSAGSQAISRRRSSAHAATGVGAAHACAGRVLRLGHVFLHPTPACRADGQLRPVLVPNLECAAFDHQACPAPIYGLNAGSVLRWFRLVTLPVMMLHRSEDEVVWAGRHLRWPLPMGHQPRGRFRDHLRRRPGHVESVRRCRFGDPADDVADLLLRLHLLSYFPFICGCTGACVSQ